MSPTPRTSSCAEPVGLCDIPLAVVVGNALNVFLRNEEAEPVAFLPDFAGQEVTVVPWNKHDGTVLQGGEPVGVCNLSENKRVNVFGGALERVDTVDLL